MLGSLSEADDAVQEAWLHVNRADTSEVANDGAARAAAAIGRSESGRREQIDNLELTLDLFNALDRVNPTAFVGAVSSPLFGRATAARTPRTAQLSLRYRF